MMGVTRGCTVVCVDIASEVVVGLRGEREAGVNEGRYEWTECERADYCSSHAVRVSLSYVGRGSQI
jgi:hypothetical protein